MTLVLFDIDGTLIVSGGVGRRAMTHAGYRLFGLNGLFHQVAFAGAIDPQIVSRGMALRGIAPTPRRIGRLKATYLRELKRRMPAATGTALPGAHDAVQVVGRSAAIGVLTGNWREGAHVKLDRFGLWEPFGSVIGAFGDDASSRDEMVPIAVRRARRQGVDVSRVIVIGDTPADIGCARAGGLALAPKGIEVLSIAVQTGLASEDVLRQAGPDLQVPDLVLGMDAVVAFVAG